jgi:hypothetical protein
VGGVRQRPYRPDWVAGGAEVIRGVSGQIVNGQLVDVGTGGAFVGAVTVYVDGDNTGQVIGSVGGGAASARGNGAYSYVPSAAETDFAHVDFVFKGVGAVGGGQNVQIDTVTPAQVQALATATGLGSVSVTDLLTDALVEIRAARAGDTVAAEILAFALGKLNRLFDRWNANPEAKYRMGFASYTLTPNHQPHTIGPSAADFTVTQRPARIEAASLVLTSVTPNVRIPLDVHHEAAWWDAVSVQGLSSSIPFDLYYDTDWPNGSIYLWPEPSTAYDLEILTAGLFNVLVATDTLWLPFGYRDAVTLTLAEELAPGTGQQVSPGTASSAMAARELIFGRNAVIPNACTRDGGMPGGGYSGGFDFRTGMIR